MTDTQTEIEAAAFRALRRHLLTVRPDVQNIDLMNMAGFCRNCLSRWMGEAAAERGVEMSKDEARALFYGMPYGEWVARHQTGDKAPVAEDRAPEDRAAEDQTAARRASST